MAVTIPAGAQTSFAEDVERFGVFERTLEHSGTYANPYVELSATAVLTEPDGTSTRRLGLFWDGASRWTFRFSPAKTGTWKYRIESEDPGLSGATGSFQVVESERSGGIQRMDGHPFHFQRQDGTPFWFFGDTGWALYTDNPEEQHDRPAVNEYIATRSRQGFNVVHSMLLSEAGWGNSGGPPFDDLSKQRINPAYWQEVDGRVRELNEHGIVAGLAIAWADKRRIEPYAWRRFPSVEARKHYARYIASRYGAFDVYFVVSGEWGAEVRTRGNVTADEVAREFVEIGNALAEADAHDRLATIHEGGGDVTRFVGAPWMDFGDYQQNYRQLHQRVLQSRRFELPVINSEYGYFLRDSNGDAIVDKDNSAAVAHIRHASWDIVMGGAYLVTGFGTTYFGGNREPGPYDVHAVQNDPWEEQIQHIPALFTSLEWWKLAPADEAITADSPRTDDRGIRVPHPRRDGQFTVDVPPKTVYWLLEDPGQTYVAYLRGLEGTVRIELGEPADYRVRRFDPRKGKFKPLEGIEQQDAYTFQPPDPRDWVLVIERSD